MSYKLEKPYTDIKRADFVVLHNHQHGRKIEETQTALYALEPDEIMQDGLPVKNPDYAAEQLAIAKETKVSEINSAKEAAFKAGFYFNEKHFDCDDRAQTRLAAQFAIAKPDTEIVWLDYDYEPVAFSYEQFVQLCNTATNIVSAIEFLTGQYLSAVNECETVEEIEAIEADYSNTAISTFLLNQN